MARVVEENTLKENSNTNNMDPKQFLIAVRNGDMMYITPSEYLM